MGRLFIAEKPSLGRAIASALGSPRRADGYIECAGGDRVTWCFGHLLELASPDHYDKRLARWSSATLPIIPQRWEKVPRDDSGARKQIKVIRELAREADELVNAGDAGREGQLLVDEVLEHIGNRKPVRRLWLSATDEKSVRRALDRLGDNRDYRNLRDEAEARGRADWLIGINTTRAMTVAGQAQGIDGVISGGRVQTPTLALVVNREKQIRSFEPVDHFVIQARFRHDNGEFAATFQPPEGLDGLDPDGYLVDRKVAERVVADIEGRAGSILSSATTARRKPPPMPHDLTSLQKEASSAFGMTASATLAAAQKLYDDKLTSYPRTECAFLPEEQFADAPAIVAMLASVGIRGADQADTGIRGRAWNTKKVVEHHGIIPTGERPGSLSGDEERVYGLICRRYLMQFYPDFRFDAQKVVVAVGEHRFQATGQRVTETGWRALTGAVSDRELPQTRKGDPVDTLEAGIEEKQTEPPSRFTDGTLLDAMSQIHRFVDDPEARARLRETSGLGTPATRANILETLFSRKYVIRKGKTIHPTDFGMAVIEAMPEELKDPATTAAWEDFLRMIGQGEATLDSFLESQAKIVPILVDKAFAVRFPGGREAKRCPECDGILTRRESKKCKGTYYWMCDSEGDDRHFFRDEDGEPGISFEEAARAREAQPKAVCPFCNEQAVLRTSKKNPDFRFWVCDNKHFHADEDGQPGRKLDFTNRSGGRRRRARGKAG